MIGKLSGGSAGGATKLSSARPKLGPIKKTAKKLTNFMGNQGKGKPQTFRPGPMQRPAVQPKATNALSSLNKGRPGLAKKQLNAAVGLPPRGGKGKTLKKPPMAY